MVHSDIRKAKQLRRRAERLWRKTRLPIHRDIFMERRDNVNDLIRKTKYDYYAKLICDNRDNTKELLSALSLAENSSCHCQGSQWTSWRKVLVNILSTRLWPLRHPLGLIAVEMQQSPTTQLQSRREPFPSAYRMNHGTETTMFRVQNDIIRALGDNKMV